MGESAEGLKARNFLKKNDWLVVKIIRCSMNGWPDYLAIKNGYHVHIEFKYYGNPKPLQTFRKLQIEQHGGYCFKAETIQEILDNFYELGIPL